MEKYNLKPLAKIIAYADAALEPEWFTIAPSEAIRKALRKAKLTLKDIDFFEINEAYSAVVLANQKILDLDMTKVNVFGGAVAMGHPLGASGARIMCTLTGTDGGDFKVNRIRVNSIDNINSKINYEGSFFGNSSDIDPIDYGVYCLLRVTAVSRDIDFANFYKELIAESYVLFKESNFKLAYFLAYSGFESFINSSLGIGDEPGRLKERLQELFKCKFLDLSRHQIYTCVVNDFDRLTDKRNTIAHGRGAVSINKKETEEALLFILILVCTYEFQCSKFDELNSKLENEK